MDYPELLTRFGLGEFRIGQREVIDAVMAGRDCLCIMPTGGGKSLCFQLPAIARPGLTVVISPLIALMKDQVDGLLKLKFPATFINSSLDPQQQSQRTQGMIRGDYALVYVAPERLRSASFLNAIRQSNVTLLAIDEAHCISQWGHDFRPDYARLGTFRRRIGSPQTVALTATATKIVQGDIAKVLELKNPVTFVSGFARDNLSLRVESPSSNSDKDRRLLEYLESEQGSGIIYAATRKSCEHLVELIQAQGKRPVAFYHAGMEPEERKRIQEAFMTNRVPLIVATNAFGMGIDKRALRFVVHYNMPGSVEAYYQEAGRAGRDGQPAECLLLFSYQDRFIQEFFIENAYPTREIVRDVFQFLKSYRVDPIELSLQQIQAELKVSTGTEGIRVCETLLEKAGAIERMDSQQNLASIRIDLPHPNLPELLPREARAQRAVMRGLELLVGDLRGERVYFSPTRFSESVEMKWDSIARALRELTKLDGVDYVPPFRGRAIHVLRPDASFDELEIDFDELERRRKSEYEKLDQIVRFVNSRRCRQLEILEYFGDPLRRICHRCDNCSGSGAAVATGTQTKLTEIGRERVWFAVQVALSGAARTHGRIGKQLLVQMLTGSNSKKLKPLRLDRIATFGRLKQLRQETVTDLVSQLLTAGWLIQTEATRYRPVIQISDEGRTLLQSAMDLRVFDAISADVASTIARTLSDIDRPDVPPKAPETRIVADAPELSCDSQSAPPADLESRRQEPDSIGSNDLSDRRVSPAKASSDTAASTLHTSIATASEPRLETARTTAPAEATVATSMDPRPAAAKPSYYWTWRLFTDGYEAAQVQQIRQIDLSQIVEELTVAAERGHVTERSWILTPRQLAELGKVSPGIGNRTATRGLREVPNGVTPGEYMYYLRSTR